MNPHSLLADVVVFVHVLYVGFVVIGLLAIIAGIALRWRWVRNFWFRTVHLTMIFIVVVEAIFGITCPLTTWEHQLRVQAGGSPQAQSFVGRMAQDLLFLNLPQWVFPLLHIAFGAAVLVTFIAAPPRLPSRITSQEVNRATTDKDE